MSRGVPLTVTVSQVNRRLALMISGDKTLADINVKGEISNFVLHYKSGHAYFTLKDHETSIKCVMFKSNADKITFRPEDGMQVVVRGGIQVFERDGMYQLYATEIEPEGYGDIYARFEELKHRLSLEGLFTKKRPLPSMPKKIVLITAKTGAALQDIVSVVERRFPIVELVLIPTLVQGADAPNSIINALKTANNTDADIIIITRGGGSAEDLWAFNDEALARAVFDSRIPTISAVGHEIDFTICDFVADLRAPTPSAAAEIAVPDINNIRFALVEFKTALKENTVRIVNAKQQMLTSKKEEIGAKSPAKKLAAEQRQLALVDEQLRLKMQSIYARKERAFLSAAERISMLNPINVMIRGYAVVYKENEIVKTGQLLKSGDEIVVKFHDTQVEAKVK